MTTKETMKKYEYTVDGGSRGNETCITSADEALAAGLAMVGYDAHPAVAVEVDCAYGRAWLIYACQADADADHDGASCQAAVGVSVDDDGEPIVGGGDQQRARA